jgi:hypothetical protein
MSRIASITTTSALIGSGVLVWAFAARSLSANPDLKVPPNPFGINRSPYGEVFAMAMQGPIDTCFDVAMLNPGSRPPVETHDKKDSSDNPDSLGKGVNPSLKSRFRNFLTYLDRSSEERTNPKAPGEALKRHLRREAEDKLRFAYQLDPSHYANYNSLHFFLTEPAVGTRPELTPSAAKLAEDTIQYCMKQEGDPRPALTAAAAATNILHLMFSDRQNPSPKYGTSHMRRCLDLLDQCLGRYEKIAKQWDESKSWDRLSPQRVNECQERYAFICKIRDAAEKTILRYEGKAFTPQVAN